MIPGMISPLMVRKSGPTALVSSFTALRSSSSLAGSFNFNNVGPIGPWVIAAASILSEGGGLDMSVTADPGSGAQTMDALTSRYDGTIGEGYIHIQWFIKQITAEEADFVLDPTPYNSFGGCVAIWNLSKEPTIHQELSSISTDGSFSINHAKGGTVLALTMGNRSTTAFTTLTATNLDKDAGPETGASRLRYGCGSIDTPSAATAQPSSFTWSGGSGASEIVRTHAISLAP